MDSHPRAQSRLRRQRVPVGSMRINRPGLEVRIALAYSLFFILASFCTGLLIRSHPLPIWGAAGLTDDFWYALFFKGFLLLAVPILVFRSFGYHLRDLAPGWRLTSKTTRILLLSFLAGNLLNLQHLDWIGEASSSFSATQLTLRVLLGLFLPLGTAGFPEEFFYRGILQTRLEAVSGRVAAILLSTILFTAWHIPTRYFLSRGIEGEAGDLVSVLLGTGVPVFAVGLVFSLIWDRYRSLWPLVAAHWGIDFLPTVSSLLGISH